MYHENWVFPFHKNGDKYLGLSLLHPKNKLKHKYDQQHDTATNKNPILNFFPMVIIHNQCKGFYFIAFDTLQDLLWYVSNNIFYKSWYNFLKNFLCSWVEE